MSFVSKKLATDLGYAQSAIDSHRQAATEHACSVALMRNQVANLLRKPRIRPISENFCIIARRSEEDFKLSNQFVCLDLSIWT